MIERYRFVFRISKIVMSVTGKEIVGGIESEYGIAFSVRNFNKLTERFIRHSHGYVVIPGSVTETRVRKIILSVMVGHKRTFVYAAFVHISYKRRCGSIISGLINFAVAAFCKLSKRGIIGSNHVLHFYSVYTDTRMIIVAVFCKVQIEIAVGGKERAYVDCSPVVRHIKL